MKIDASYQLLNLDMEIHEVSECKIIYVLSCEGELPILLDINEVYFSVCI